MADSKNKRYKLFKKFSQNLEWVKEHPKVRFEPDFKDGYICPLCMECFFEPDLLPEASNQLTIEHIPPESLGGKSRTLTCKDCNSKSGYKLDAHLLNRLLELDFQAFLPNAKTKTKFKLNENQVTGSFEIDKQGNIKIDLKTNNSNPIEAKQFMKDLIPPRTIYNPNSFFHQDKVLEPNFQTATFSFQKINKADSRRAEIALLRIAYLYAFSVFGHSFLINPALSIVRKQIITPEESILPYPFWIKYDFSDEWDGINLIREPEELRCFLIIFNLKTESITRKCAIAIPGSSKPGFKIYENIERMLCTDSGFQNLQIDHIADFDYLEKKEYAFDSHVYWAKINSINT